MDHRVRGAGADLPARCRRCRRPDARVRPDRPGARDDPADAVLPADAAALGLLLDRYGGQPTQITSTHTDDELDDAAVECDEECGGRTGGRLMPTPGRLAVTGPAETCTGGTVTWAPPEPTPTPGAGTVAPSPGRFTPT